MPQAHLKIIRIVGRRDLDDSRTKLRIDKIVLYHLQLAVKYRENNFLIFKLFVPFIQRINRYGCVSQHCFRTGSGNDYVLAGILFAKRIPDMPELAFNVGMLALFVGQSSHAAGTPVDYVIGPVNQLLLIQFNKNPCNSLAQAIVHGKSLSLPVAGGAQPF